MGSTLRSPGYREPLPWCRGFRQLDHEHGRRWVTPRDRPLRAPGTPPSAQLLFRFTSAGSYARSAPTWPRWPGRCGWHGDRHKLLARRAGRGDRQRAIMEPFVVAFALIGLVMAVLIVGNVVSGAVVAGYHRIGVLKSLGLTRPRSWSSTWPGRLARLAGCLPAWWRQSAGRPGAAPVGCGLRVGRQQVPWWASIAARSGYRTDGAGRARPALRAGRLSAAEAIAAGRPAVRPRVRRASARRRLRLPRPVGWAWRRRRPARPHRRVAGGDRVRATAVIFAFGLHASLGRAAASQTLSGTVPVQIQQFGRVGPAAGASAAQNAR